LSKQQTSNLEKSELEALINLSKNKDIIISKSDKDKACVIQNKCDYLEKIYKLLNTPGKFVKLKNNPTKKRSNKLIELLRDIKERKEEVVDHRCKNKLRTVIVHNWNI